MVEIATHTTCPQHPAELAVAECDHCGTPVCTRCRVEGVVTNDEFCSEACCEAREAPVTQQFLRGLDHPVTTGWQIWIRSLRPLVIHGAVVALFGAILLDIAPAEPVDAPTATTIGISWVLILALTYSMALVATVMSQEYTGYIEGNAAMWTARRWVPWAATSVLLYGLTTLGFIALIIPGVILSTRLFWADEFALAHNAGPIRALRESWRLTSGQIGKLFVFQIMAGLASWLVVLGGTITFVVLGTVVSLLGDHATLLLSWLLVFLAFVGYGAMHGPELARFYGMYAARHRGYDPDAPVRLGIRKRVPRSVDARDSQGSPAHRPSDSGLLHL